jgi:hypothetical protein
MIMLLLRCIYYRPQSSYIFSDFILVKVCSFGFLKLEDDGMS